LASVLWAPKSALNTGGLAGRERKGRVVHGELQAFRGKRAQSPNRRRRSDFRRDLPTKDILKKLLHGKSPLLTFALRFPGWVMDSVYSGLTDN
jgi:hypothetical protein